MRMLRLKVGEWTKGVYGGKKGNEETPEENGRRVLKQSPAPL